MLHKGNRLLVMVSLEKKVFLIEIQKYFLYFQLIKMGQSLTIQKLLKN
ncbi:hypothetical protein SAG0146_02760 [Streptococcus agalactiae MRI Z1-039]|nr:hypothetical protein SAG0146_02760 [Streptococcus agalactiae MRI Z1-039]